jgi:large-conductance mechanosensitive channel
MVEGGVVVAMRGVVCGSANSKILTALVAIIIHKEVTIFHSTAYR